MGAVEGRRAGFPSHAGGGNRIFFQVGGGHWVWPPAGIIITTIRIKKLGFKPEFFLFLV